MAALLSEANLALSTLHSRLAKTEDDRKKRKNLANIKFKSFKEAFAAKQACYKTDIVG
jgi:hypothetical protein